jgi:glyceraldehyde 3-phosphate dehydrogenase/glyceraldehyde-3-phosphate dehydrogenase (NAD(P))
LKKIAINGLGRIGRLVLRNCLINSPNDIDIVVANDLISPDELAYLIRHDSVHGEASFQIESGRDYLQFGSKKLNLFSEKNPENIPWKEFDVDIVLECTGLFRRREDAAKHLDAGATKVIISAPSESADLTLVMGVNEKSYDPANHHIISNASCTTNSLAPVVKVLDDAFGIESLMATTIHAYTSSQSLVDSPARKRRRGRAAAVSLIPTTTGAAKATTLVIPKLEGKMDAIAVRAPVPDGALTDIVVCLKKDITVETVNSSLRNAANTKLKNILAYSEEELVSADIIGNTHSGIIDASSTRVINNNVAKVLVWYDNEYGYARRMLDVASYVAKC